MVACSNPDPHKPFDVPDVRSLLPAFVLCYLIKGNPSFQNLTASVNRGENRDSYVCCIVSSYLIVALDSIYKCFICHNLGFSIEKGLETIFDGLKLLLAYLQNTSKGGN